MCDSSRGIHRRIEIPLTPEVEARLWAGVSIGEPDQCWEWQRATRSGYGVMRIGSQLFSCHRIAFTITNGEPPEGKIVTHSCDNRLCCNPKHLQAGTPLTNVQDMYERGQPVSRRGSDAHHATLTSAEVAAIWEVRKQYGWGKVRIAKHLSLPVRSVRSVLHDGHYQDQRPAWVK